MAMIVAAFALAAANVTATAGAAPPRLRTDSACAPAGGLRFICGVSGAEDLVALPGSPWLIASGLNLGSLAFLHAVDTRRKTARSIAVAIDAAAGRRGDCPGPPDMRRWSTDGLGLRQVGQQRYRLYAANHGDRHAIEMFRVQVGASGPRVTWEGCAPMPAGTLANAVVPLRDGSLIVSSFHDPGDTDAWRRMARREPTGSLWQWRAGAGFRRIAAGPISGANGLAVSGDERYLYVSAWSERRLLILDRRTGARRAVALDFLPDNIKPAARGGLLVAGQKSDVLSIAGCGANCPQRWVVARIDPRRATVTKLMEHGGTNQVNYACTALIAGGTLYVTVRGDRRIAFVPLRRPRA